MSLDATKLTAANVLLPSAVMEGGKHYTAGVFWTGPGAHVEPAAIIRELEALSVRAMVASQKTGNWYWFSIEPENNMPVGQLVLLGYRFGAIFGVWEYTTEPESALDLREFLADTGHGLQAVSAFIWEHWKALSVALLVLLAVFVYVVTRKR